MPYDHPGEQGDVSPDELPTLGEGPDRVGAPSATPGGTMLKRDRLLNPNRQELQEDPEEVDDSRLVKILLLGVVLFVLVDVVIVAVRFGWVGGGGASTAPVVEAPAVVPKPTQLEGVPVKEALRDGMVGPPVPEPAQRPIDPPDM
ncbi:MAG: hypothetical protein ACI8PZ_000335 [Myxococcota bacterium]|jgi:hypothetical protein